MTHTLHTCIILLYVHTELVGSPTMHSISLVKYMSAVCFWFALHTPFCYPRCALISTMPYTYMYMYKTSIYRCMLLHFRQYIHYCKYITCCNLTHSIMGSAECTLIVTNTLVLSLSCSTYIELCTLCTCLGYDCTVFSPVVKV